MTVQIPTKAKMKMGTMLRMMTMIMVMLLNPRPHPQPIISTMKQQLQQHLMKRCHQTLEMKMAQSQEWVQLVKAQEWVSMWRLLMKMRTPMENKNNWSRRWMNHMVHDNI
jgi:hypothetical protein